MSRILVIGTSHVAALKRAYSAAAEANSAIAIVDFFACPAALFRDFARIDGTWLRIDIPSKRVRDIAVVKNINSALEVDAAGYTQVFLSGIHHTHQVLARTIARHDIDGLLEGGTDRPPLSLRAYDALCKDLANDMCPPPDWRLGRAGRVWLLPSPRVSELSVSVNEPDIRNWRRIAELDLPAAAAFDHFDRCYAHVLAENGFGYIEQPAETITCNGLTLKAFSESARRLRDDEVHRAEDVRHMNDRYGALILDQILTASGTATTDETWQSG